MINIKENIIRQELSSRGGGIEISLDNLGWAGVKMTAYQNYLGGGMLGKICNSCTISDWAENAELSAIAEELRKYMHELTNHDDDEWESASYEENQNRSVSAY